MKNWPESRNYELISNEEMVDALKRSGYLLEN